MRIYTPLLILLFVFSSCEAQDKINFAPEALQDTFITLEDKNISFQEILDKNIGKTVLIDIWASWCKDCIVGMPKVRELQKEYPEVAFVFLSLDKDQALWKRGIKRFKITQGQHYYNPRGWKSPFNKSIDLDWVPRYIIVNPEGKMSLFRATKASDKKINKILNTH